MNPGREPSLPANIASWAPTETLGFGCSALPFEALRPAGVAARKLVRQGGVEPSVSRLSDEHPDRWTTGGWMGVSPAASPEGVEPPTFGLGNRCPSSRATETSSSSLGCPGGFEPQQPPGSQPGAQTSARTPEQEHGWPGGESNSRLPVFRRARAPATLPRPQTASPRRIETSQLAPSEGFEPAHWHRLTAGRSTVELRWKERGAAAVWATAASARDAA